MRNRAGASLLPDPEIVAVLMGGRLDDPLADATPRERETLALMAEGRSDAGIAAHQVIAERSVEKNVSAVFGELGLTSAGDVNRRVLAVLTYLGG